MTNREIKMAMLFEPGNSDPDSKRTASYKFHPPKSGELVVQSGAPVKEGAEYVLDDLQTRFKIKIMRTDHRKRFPAQEFSGNWQTECLFEVID